MAEFVVNPDSEMMEQALVLSLLVKGRTVLEDFQWTPRGLAFAESLREFGLSYELKGHQLVLEGMGFQYKAPMLLPYRLETHALILLWTLASSDTETIYTIAFEEGDSLASEKTKKLIHQYFLAELEKETSDSIQFRFQEGTPKYKKNSQGDLPYLMRNRLLLSALIQGGDLSFEERSALRDQWTRMMVYFGADLKYESKGMENMDELSRRIAKARGVKLERTWSTTFSPTKILTAREYFVPGDVTELIALCLVVILAKIPKDESFIIKNVCINTGRAGALTALKRMGASIETISKRERYGDAFGDVEVKPLGAKRLQGRRFSEDLMASCMDEYPLLALAACYAEGETILRIPPEYKVSCREDLEWLALNLRKTGVEIGVYDDGLVIRGKDELDGGEFDAANNPLTALTLFIVSLLGRGNSSIVGLESMESTFPQISEKIKSIIQKGNHESQ